jgi:DNA invertase Pin-like site-specific DNA recombinase
MQKAGIIFGHARVSTDAQDLANQLAQLRAAGCEKVFREKITGATADRPALRKLMAALGLGDVVIIPTVDRLSRDTTDLPVIACEMQRAGAGIRSPADCYSRAGLLTCRAGTRIATSAAAAASRPR